MKLRIFAVGAVLAIAGAVALPVIQAGAQSARVAIMADASDLVAAPDGDTSPAVPLQNCESSGSWCARDANDLSSFGNRINEGTEVSGPAENTRFVADGGHFLFGGINFPTGVLKLTGHTNLCYGTENIGVAVITQPCAGGQGTVIGHGKSNGHEVWVVRRSTVQFGSLQVIAGANVQGDQLTVVQWTANGPFKRWELQ